LIAANIGYRVAASTDVAACERIIDGEVRSALTELSRWEPGGASAEDLGANAG
jgi:hypothetical protein